MPALKNQSGQCHLQVELMQHRRKGLALQDVRLLVHDLFTVVSRAVMIRVVKTPHLTLLRRIDLHVLVRRWHLRPGRL